YTNGRPLRAIDPTGAEACDALAICGDKPTATQFDSERSTTLTIDTSKLSSASVSDPDTGESHEARISGVTVIKDGHSFYVDLAATGALLGGILVVSVVGEAVVTAGVVEGAAAALGSALGG